MTVIHVVLFKFLPSVTASHKETFASELKQLRELSCVQNRQLFVGGPSITTPIERSKGFEIALVSFHQDREALREYQASVEHKRVTDTYLWPFQEDVCRFDFEVAEGEKEVARMFVSAEDAV